MHIFGALKDISIVAAIIIVLTLVLCTYAYPYIKALPYYIHRQYPFPEHYNYWKRGQIIGFINRRSINSIPECDTRLYSKILRERRSVYVYLPPGYDEGGDSYPLMIVLHGFGRNHLCAANIFPPLLDKAIKRGHVPPIVMVSPDFSISNTGRENPMMVRQRKLGSFYINSNRGRFEDHFIQELLPWIRQEFHVSHLPWKVILLGQSMGGFGAFSWGLRYPNISSILVGIYPSVDLRYSCGGDSQADYDPDNYLPLTRENPERKVMSIFGGLINKKEKDMLYPVFKGDSSLDDIWPESMSFWDRVREYNPTDILRDKRYGDISNTKMYLIAGDQDEYNADSKVLSFITEVKRQGLTVFPEQPIKKNGHHSPDFAVKQLPEIFRWLGVLLNQ